MYLLNQYRVTNMITGTQIDDYMKLVQFISQPLHQRYNDNLCLIPSAYQDM